MLNNPGAHTASNSAGAARGACTEPALLFGVSFQLVSLAADQLAGLLRLAIGRWLEVEIDGSSYPCSSAGRITLEGLKLRGLEARQSSLL